MKAGAVYVATLLALAGCGTIEQKVKPVALSNGAPREICVIENTAVRRDFLDAYKDALAKRHFVVKTLPASATVDACPLATTYIALWRWDLALYLAYTKLKIYRNGSLEGEAFYDSLQAAGNANKFINATTKVQELTDQLFPG